MPEDGPDRTHDFRRWNAAAVRVIVHAGVQGIRHAINLVRCNPLLPDAAGHGG